MTLLILFLFLRADEVTAPVDFSSGDLFAELRSCTSLIKSKTFPDNAKEFAKCYQLFASHDRPDADKPNLTEEEAGRYFRFSIYLNMAQDYLRSFDARSMQSLRTSEAKAINQRLVENAVCSKFKYYVPMSSSDEPDFVYNEIVQWVRALGCKEPKSR